MKLLTTIAAVLISLSAFSQDLIEYDNGTFTQNGEELSMKQIDDLTLLHQAGRGNFRGGNSFDFMHNDIVLRRVNNSVNLVHGAATGFFGGVGVLFSYFIVTDISSYIPVAVPVVLGATTGLCVVSYKAFSRIALSPEGCLRKRDKEFYKVAYKLNQKVADKLNRGIKAANQ
jgi:hypothetical protein